MESDSRIACGCEWPFSSLFGIRVIRCCRYRLKNFQWHNFSFRLQTFHICCDFGIQWALDVMWLLLLLLLWTLSDTKYTVRPLWPIAYSIFGTVIMQNAIGMVDSRYIARWSCTGFYVIRCRLQIPSPHTNRFFMFCIWLILRFCYRIEWESFYFEQRKSAS